MARLGKYETIKRKAHTLKTNGDGHKRANTKQRPKHVDDETNKRAK